MKSLVKTGFVLTLMISFLVSCNGPKKLTKKGNKYQEAGFYQEAIDHYIQALNKDKTYLEAQNQLKTAAREVLNDKTSVFFKAYNNQDYKQTVYSYLEIQKFIEFVNKYNADLSIPHQYTLDFEDAKSKYLNQQFELAGNKMGEEDFESAERILDEIHKLDPNFKGAEMDKIHEMAKLEPHYRAGKKHLMNDKNRAAYYEFEYVTKENSNYKDAKFLKEEALANAQYNIAVYDFQNYTDEKGAEELIRGKVIEQIINSNNPFVKIVDRQHSNKINLEQQNAIDGKYDRNTMIKAGNVLGAQAMLNGKIVQVKQVEGNMEVTSKKAYEKSREKIFDAQLDRHVYITNYKKVRYNEYSQKNYVILTFQYQLVSLETGEILSTRTFTEKKESSVNYAKYNGNYKNLVPGNWKNQGPIVEGDEIQKSRANVNNLQSLFTNSQEIMSTTLLTQQAYGAVVNDIVAAVLAYNPEQ
jgi:tetratricopeptide (TPR) repeat protein